MKITYTASLTVCIIVAFSSVVSAAENTFRWVTKEPGQRDLMYGDHPVLRYMHAYDDSTPEKFHETYKVYHHVFGPRSGKIITKGAGGKYTHHRGLYVGWNKTQTSDGGFDFWHCKNGAHLAHAEFVSESADANHAESTVEIHWNDKDNKAVIKELRTIRVSITKVSGERAWLIDWSTKLSSQRGEIQLRGDRQHAGFQFRAAQAVADAGSARYVRPDGFPDKAEAFQVGDKGDPPAHINLKWFAMNFPLDGSHYNVEYFEAPGQPAPSLYSERPYGRFGAFYKADLTEDKPLQMTYRLVVSEGDTPEQSDIQKRYDDYLTSLQAKTQ